MRALLYLQLLAQFCAGPPNNVAPLPIWRGHSKSDANGKTYGAYLAPDLESIVVLNSKNIPRVVSLHTKIFPVVRTRIIKQGNSPYHLRYDYAIANGSQSLDSISHLYVVVPLNFTGGLPAECVPLRASTSLWYYLSVPKKSQCELASNAFWLELQLNVLSASRIKPGMTNSNPICVISDFLPGFSTAYLGGEGLQVEDEWVTERADLSISSNRAFVDVHKVVLAPVLPASGSCEDAKGNYLAGLTRLLQENIDHRTPNNLRSLRELLGEDRFCDNPQKISEIDAKPETMLAEILTGLRLALHLD